MAKRKLTEKQLEVLEANAYKKGEQRAKDNAERSHAKRRVNTEERKTLKKVLEEIMDEQTRKDLMNALVTEALKGNTAAYDRIVDKLNEDDGTTDNRPAFNLVVPKETAELLKKLAK